MDMGLVGKRIKERRVALGITLQQIADAVGLNKSTVQRYENGTIKEMKLPVIESIASFLNVNPLWLTGEADEEQHSEEYERALYMMDLNFRSVVKWSENQFFTEEETIIIREHFYDLLQRYKFIVEGYANLKIRWEEVEGPYKEIYKERLSDEEIRELFLKTELERQLKDATNWIDAFPNWIARKGK